MKKTFYFFIGILFSMAFIATFSSCSDDKEESNDNELLIGKWEHTSDSVLYDGETEYKLHETYDSDKDYDVYDGKNVTRTTTESIFGTTTSETYGYTYKASEETLKIGNSTITVLSLSSDKLILNGGRGSATTTINGVSKTEQYTLKQVYTKVN